MIQFLFKLLLFMIGYYIGYKRGRGDWWCDICMDKKNADFHKEGR